MYPIHPMLTIKSKGPLPKNDKMSTVTIRDVTSQNRLKPKKNNKKRRNKNNKALQPTGILGSVAGDYLRTLNDPFNYGPVRLGYNTMVPTRLATYTSRSTVTVNSDGSVAFIMSPFPAISAASPIYYSTGSISTVSWAGLVYSNFSTVATFIGEYRPVSMGIRVLPMIAATSTPGLVYSGTIPNSTLNQMVSQAPNVYINNPSAEWGDARNGVVVVARPLDNRSYEFGSTTVPGTTLSNFSCPFIVFTGLPVSTSVAFEVVLNVEGTRDSIVSSTGDDIGLETGNTTVGPTVSDIFPTVEGMWKQVQFYLDNPTTFTSDLSRVSKFTGEISPTLLGGAAAAAGTAYGIFQRARRRN